MISLKDYIFFEDEDKFVKVDYDTVTSADDGMDIAKPINIEYKDNMGDGVSITPDDEDTNKDDILPGGVDEPLVGELRLYSETNDLYKERKRVIANKFKSLLKDNEINANRVRFTKVFDYYINHLIDDYKKNIDNNFKINVSSKKELYRQLSDDLVLLIRDREILPKN